jgi:hypothetical protein
MLQAVRRYLTACNKKDLELEAAEAEAKAKPKKLKQMYTIRDVIKQNYRALVNDQIPYKPTDKGYLPSFQRAVTTVLKNMSDEELETAETMVEKWNTEGAPSEVQLK